jgi:hypothetical protein
MKKIIIAVSTVCILTAFGCKKDESIEVELNYNPHDPEFVYKDFILQISNMEIAKYGINNTQDTVTVNTRIDFILNDFYFNGDSVFPSKYPLKLVLFVNGASRPFTSKGKNLFFNSFFSEVKAKETSVQVKVTRGFSDNAVVFETNVVKKTLAQ